MFTLQILELDHMDVTVPIEESNFTPGLAELLFMLFESTNLISYTQANRFPNTCNTLQGAVLHILGIHSKGIPSAVRLDNGHVPSLLVVFDHPAFLDYVKTTITLLRTLARADDGRDSLTIQRTAQSGLLASILRHSLGPHAREYTRLRDRLQEDLDCGTDERFEEDVEDPEDPDSDYEDLVRLETKCSRAEAEKWRDGLTHALGVIQEAADMARDNNDAVWRFWAWAKQRYAYIDRRNGKRVYAHVGEYLVLIGLFSEIDPPSATDLLKYVDHIVQAVVFPIITFTAAEKPDPSSLAWLHTLTIRRLENSPRSSSDFEDTPVIDHKRLRGWLFDLVYNPLHNARVSREVLERIISTEADVAHAQWVRYDAEASVHPEMTHLIEFINTRLALPVPNSEKDPGQQRTNYPSLVACTSTSCPTCVLCYKATKAAYGLRSSVLNLFPTDGEISSPSPCYVPPLPPVVEEKLKVMLTEEIRRLVKRTIMRLSPKPPFRRRPEGNGQPSSRAGPVQSSTEASTASQPK